MVYVLAAARTSYRLLLLEADAFSKRRDWSCFNNLVPWSLNIDLNKNEDFAEELLSCFLRWKKYCQYVSFEKFGWYLDLHEQNQLEQNVTVDLNHENCLRFLGMNCMAVSPAQHVEIEPLSGGTRNAHLAGDPFIMTSTVEESFEIVLLAVNQKCPVLLYGPAGARKTAFINKLAWESRN